MKLADLSAETRARVAEMRFDRFVEKHEGPWNWRYWLEDDGVEFLTVEEFDLLLPVPKEQHPNITIVRAIAGEDRRTVTVFLTNTTWETGMLAGYFAVCEQVPGEAWYLATAYHEWFVLDDLATQWRSAPA
jgi:hypothetical protein